MSSSGLGANGGVSLAARPRRGLTVLAHRGVAGIDGTIATATGAALAHPQGTDQAAHHVPHTRVRPDELVAALSRRCEC